MNKDLINRLEMIKEFIKKVKAKDSHVRGYADARGMMMETMDEAIKTVILSPRLERRTFVDRRHYIKDIEGGVRSITRRKKDDLER